MASKAAVGADRFGRPPFPAPSSPSHRLRGGTDAFLRLYPNPVYMGFPFIMWQKQGSVKGKMPKSKARGALLFYFRLL